MPQVRAGTHQGLCGHRQSRWLAAPDVPTVTRPACPASTCRSGTAFWVPKGTPKDIIARLNAAVVEALADPAVRARLAELGQEISPREQQTPEALAALHKAEIEKWWPIIKAGGHQGGVNKLQSSITLERRIAMKFPRRRFLHLRGGRRRAPRRFAHGSGAQTYPIAAGAHHRRLSRRRRRPTSSRA